MSFLHSRPHLKILFLNGFLFLSCTGLLVVVEWFAANLPVLAAPSGNIRHVITSEGEYNHYSPEGDIRRFNGEVLKWDVDFLLFSKAASVEVKFFKEDNLYHATLLAETKGFVGFFTSYRKHFYHSKFEVIDNGNRVRTIRFIRQVIIGQRVEETNHILDYHNRNHFWMDYVNKKQVDQGREDIPPQIFFDDILAAFYNFRNQVYGKVEKGKGYLINTIPEKSMKAIQVYIYTENEKRRIGNDSALKPKNEYLIKIKIPKDVFKTKDGELIFWTSKHLIPLETTVKNYILLGDLHGEFRGGVFPSSDNVAEVTSDTSKTR
ncbi:conserved exported hypothetical protein, contains DUF3108 [Nitrospina gracilis 3/211]|uniref:DUF3108 domain-containing protein n=1 Tax=Nitrospina gracilis (strain 3/211) TaxID=1266370 RepID=M1ZE28_NITG3|nr:MULTISPECIES: DUF3108 domain-containing protein [Nitrospina]MCF8724601.1 hypothetical protein [Nitrospina sp. Nb-3]CCQ91782.1 conserved exported hypothetical protein, contains DUF3108 [Nitrospina gracilis 3/211]